MPVTGGTDLLNLDWRIVRTLRPIRLLAESFVATNSLAFSSRIDLGGAATATPTNGTLVVSDTGAFNAAFLTGLSPAAPYFTMILDVKSQPAQSGLGGADYDEAGPQLVKDSNNYLAVNVGYQTTPTIILRVGGSYTFFQNTPATVATVATPYRLALVVCAGATAQASCWLDRLDGTGWKCLVTADVSAMGDLTDPAILAQWKYGFYCANRAAGSFTLNAYAAGLFGDCGLREVYPVTKPDGTPYVANNALWLTADNTGPTSFGSSDIRGTQAAHTAVWAMDLNTFNVTEKGKILARVAGHVYGHQDSRMVLQWDAQGRCLLIMNAWATAASGSPVDSYYTYLNTPPLSGLQVVDFSTTLTLPTPGGQTSNYDVDAKRFGGTCYLAYTAWTTRNLGTTTFYPVLASGPDLEHLSLVGADSNHAVQREGTQLVTVNGAHYVCTSSLDAAQPFHAYDLAMSHLGVLKSPNPCSGGSLGPHAAVIAVPGAGGTTRYLLITFSDSPTSGAGFWSCGDLVVMQATQQPGGSEFPWVDAALGGAVAGNQGVFYGKAPVTGNQGRFGF